MNKKPIPMRPISPVSGSSSTSTTTSIYIYIIIALILGLIRSYAGSLTNFFSSSAVVTSESTQTGTNLTIGQVVQITGTITSRTYSPSYSYTISSPEYGTVGLISTNIALSDVGTGRVAIQGTVTDIVKNIPILALETIAYIDPLPSTDNVVMSGDISYIYKPSLRSIVGSSVTSMISYTACPGKSCQALQTSLEESNALDFVDTYSNKYYKVPESDTWYVPYPGGSFRIQSTDEQIRTIADQFHPLTQSYIDSVYISRGVSICQDAGVRLSRIDRISLGDYDDGQRLVFNGSTIGGDVYICTASINPSKPNGATMTSLVKKIEIHKLGEEGEKKNMIDENKNSEKTMDGIKAIQPSAKLINPSSIKQFSITTTKPLIYTLRGGQTISYPSQNITFSSAPINESIAGLPCYGQTYITNYANKSSLTTDPRIVIYTCKGDAMTTPSETMRSMTASGSTFIIDIKDLSWYDFANGIEIH